jgi:hypothetical protein
MAGRTFLVCVDDSEASAHALYFAITTMYHGPEDKILLVSCYDADVGMAFRDGKSLVVSDAAISAVHYRCIILLFLSLTFGIR